MYNTITGKYSFLRERERCSVLLKNITKIRFYLIKY